MSSGRGVFPLLYSNQLGSIKIQWLSLIVNNGLLIIHTRNHFHVHQYFFELSKLVIDLVVCITTEIIQ